jgi:hypothetical protein
MTTQPGIPIVIGITGHRDIPPDDVPVIQSAVREQLDRLRKNHTATPVILLTALAEGADCIAAHAAIETGTRIGVVLPMSQVEYERDFPTEASINEFRLLLQRADWIHIVTPSVDAAEADPDTFRNQQYLDAGIYIARHSQMLFALWDGDKAEKIGGTSHIVRLYQTGRYPSMGPESLLSFPDSGPVIHIATRRASNPGRDSTMSLGTVEFLPPSPIETSRTKQQADAMTLWEKERWERVLTRMDQFNRDAQHFRTEHPDKIQQSRQYLVGDSAAACFGNKALNALEVYEVADAMSNQGNVRRLALFQWIIGIAMLSIFFEQLYSGPFMVWPWLALCLITGVGAYQIFRKIRTERLEDRYLDYRALAEGARVQFFWKIAGIAKNTADHYLKEQRDELEWIRQVLRCLDLPRRSGNEAVEMPVREGIEFSLDKWVRDQFNYFSGKHQKAQLNRLAEEKIAKRAKTLFVAGIGVLMFTVLFQIFAAPLVPEAADNILQFCVVSYGMLFWALPAVKLYGDTMAFSEQAKRYKKMGYYYGICEHHLTKTVADGNISESIKLLREIGKQALVENGDWLLLHRQRPVQVPLIE